MLTSEEIYGQLVSFLFGETDLPTFSKWLSQSGREGDTAETQELIWSIELLLTEYAYDHVDEQEFMDEMRKIYVGGSSTIAKIVWAQGGGNELSEEEFLLAVHPQNELHTNILRVKGPEGLLTPPRRFPYLVHFQTRSLNETLYLSFLMDESPESVENLSLQGIRLA